MATCPLSYFLEKVKKERVKIMQITKPQVFTAIVALAVIGLVLVFRVPADVLEKMMLAIIVAISNIGMALLAQK